MQHVHHFTRLDTKWSDRPQKNKKHKELEAMFENQNKNVSPMNEASLHIRHQRMSQLLPRETPIEHYGSPLRAPLIEWDPWIVIPAQIQDLLNPNIKDVLKNMNIHTLFTSKGDRTPHLRTSSKTYGHSRHTSISALPSKIWPSYPNPYQHVGIERV